MEKNLRVLGIDITKQMFHVVGEVGPVCSGSAHVEISTSASYSSMEHKPRSARSGSSMTAEASGSER